MGEASVTGGGPPAAAAVRVLAVSRVVPAASSSSAGATAGEGRVKLCFFDTPWVVLPPIQRVFLYELPGVDDDAAEFPALVRRLKDSLAATLAAYVPLAGKLAHDADTGGVAVDCAAAADDPGVAFVEADAEAEGTTMCARRLARDEAHDIPAFRSLVPDLDARVLPAPVLAVQATRLAGGLALGVSVHHAVADGNAVWRFVAAWAAAARGEKPVSDALPAPHYCRDVARVPDDDELARRLLQMIVPNLPSTSLAVDYDFSHRFALERRTFYLSGDAIQALKRRIEALAAAEDAENAAAAADGTASRKNKPVSTFVALSALGWTAFVRSKGLGAGDDTYMVFMADLRARMDPPVPEGYLGNCIKACPAGTDAGDLGGGERGLLRACRAVQAAVAAEVEAAPLAGLDRWMERMMRLPFERMCNVAASPRFRVYDAADFGFGRPARVELVSMNNDGEMVLVGGREPGEVQLSVSLDPARMEEFKAHVLAATAPPAN
ncbi:hypothetical protein U9M48_040700 [Paspalum notatum var. saurae]|uniref:Uncharacterized protein n=1 Tax=Paspalum notatum var. saurae TaxID=547442 RepID=A0AAQ3ULN2_PASNO